MSRRLIVRQETETDVQEAALWYEGQQTGLGLEFTAEVRTAIRNAVEWPLVHRLLRSRPPVRRVLTERFRYRVFYLVREDAVVVFAVIHAARHDREWKRRL